MVYDEHGIGGGGEYFGGNETQLGRISVLYHEASGGKNILHAVLMDLEQGVIDAEALSRRSASSSALLNPPVL
jgi:hypothetical protein